MNGSQVLLVDLVSSRRDVLSDALDEAGFQVRTASSFARARQALDDGPPDVLVTQLRLGANNGLHLVLMGRIRYPLMGAIVTSRHSDVLLEEEARNMGVTFMLWPFDRAAFAERVRASVNRFGEPPGTALCRRTPAGPPMSRLWDKTSRL